VDLNELREIATKERSALPSVSVCTAAGCMSSGAATVLKTLQDSTHAAGLDQQVKVRSVGCMRLCCQGPLVRIDADRALYQKVTADQASSIVAGVRGGPVEAERCDPDNPFFRLQASVVLENSGVIEPERIESYIAADGYQSLELAIRDRTPSQIVEAVTRSGLRGRGGAGYPTGVKWGLVARGKAERKFVVCNADEGDPGAFMNRSVLESDPHRVLEGMAIAGYAIGASQGYVYVRGEYLADIVYSPIVDAKHFPEGVDITLIE
jgi:bidirectional [NiFe] hydrogenase diaphorase subunit